MVENLISLKQDGGLNVTLDDFVNWRTEEEVNEGAVEMLTIAEEVGQNPVRLSAEQDEEEDLVIEAKAI